LLKIIDMPPVINNYPMNLAQYKDFYYGNRAFGLNPLPGIWGNTQLNGINNGLVGFGRKPFGPQIAELQPLEPTANNNLVGIKPATITPGQKFTRLAAGVLSNPEMLGGITAGVAGAAQIVGDAVQSGKGTFTEDAKNNFVSDQQGDLANFNNAAFSADNTSDIIGLAGMMPEFTNSANNIETQQYSFGKTLGSVGKGAAAGAVLGLPGIIGGGLVGLVSDLVGQGVGIFGDKKRKEQAIAQAQALDEQAASTLNYGTQRVSNLNYKRGMANYLNNAAMGGPLFTHGSDFSDDLTRVDAGGSHESNPLGGVPAGIDPQGVPNLVEEGETIWDNGDEEYVFSKRLKAPKSLVKEFKLGGGKNGLSYSEAARRISEKSGATLRPNDPISRRTKDDQLAQLEDSQEQKRAGIEKRKLLNALSQMSPEELQGMFAPQQGMPMEASMPPQGGMEEPLMQEPVQGGGMYEPIGIQGFAFGGPAHILSGEGEESRKVTLAGPRRLPHAVIIGYPDRYDKEIQIEQDDKGQWWVEGRMVGKGSAGEAAAQRYARQIADIRATNNMSGDLGGESIVQAERKQTPVLESRASTTTPLNRTYNIFNTPYLNADFSGFEAREQALPDRLGTVNPDEVYDAQGVGRFLPDDYASLFGRIHAPSGYNRAPGWSVIVPEAQASETVQETPPEQKPKSRGVGVRTSQPEPAWTPKKIFSISGVNPIDAWKKNSVMYNVPQQKTPVQTAVEQENQRKQLDMLPTWMRYAPIVGSGLSVLGSVFDNPDYSDYEGLVGAARRLGRPVAIPVETIGNRLRRNPFDERLAVNQANNNFLASVRGTMDTAGGNRAYRQFANNLLAYNNQGALSDIAAKSYLANRQDALQTADFNRGTDMYNANAINQRNLTQAQLNSNREQTGFNALLGATQALDNARRYDEQFVDADLTGLLEGLGRLGKENASINMIRSLANEGVRDYAIGRNGEVSFIPGSGYRVKNGGKIKTKKRRF
jgi:hypothetical protein